MEQNETIPYLPSNHLVRSKLLGERKIFLWGQVDDESSKAIVEQIAYLEAS